MKLKDIATNTFMVLSQDTELLNLLEVPSMTMKSIREQIIEDKYPIDLVEDSRSRICVYENPSSPSSNPLIEKGWIEIDIYVTKDKNRIDRRVLQIAQRIIDLIDTTQRQKQCLHPVIVGIGLNYYNRLANLPTDNWDWIKYGLIFSYDHIK